VSWWRRARDEAAGAYRSARYELAKRSGPRHDTTEILYPEYDAYEPDDRYRRAAMAGGLGLVLAAAVVGVYFAVAGGMGVLIAYGSPGSPAQRPAASPSPSGSPVPTATPPPTPSASAPPPSPSHRPSGRATPTRRATRPAPTPTGTATTRPATNSPSPAPSPSVTQSGSAGSGHAPLDQP
jgi:hypothetical protein